MLFRSLVLAGTFAALATLPMVGFAEISEVRGLGLMIGVEFERNDGSHAPDAKLRDRVMQKCFEKGLLLLSCGESTLRFCPPLIVAEEEVATAMRLFEAAIAEAR